jgi:DNA-binding response OmpR family regulator
MNMPGMDGWTFAQVFNDKYGRSTPIVIMTAEDDSRTRAMEIGADSYLGKPFGLEDLLKTVGSMLP